MKEADIHSIDPNSIPIPRDPIEALSLPYSREWRAAYDGEMKNFDDTNSFSYVRITDVPKDAIILSGRWIPTIKLDADGNLKSLKCRWVIKGYTQQFARNFFEVNSPTPSMDAIRLLLAIAASTKMLLFHDDCKSAYLHATIDIKDGIFCYQPKGYVKIDPTTGQPYVWRLNSSVYGTRQAGRQWMRCLTDHLFAIGFKRLTYENCAFYRLSHGKVLFLIVYVDDLLCLASDNQTHEEFLHDMRTRFEVTSGPLTKFLGCTVTEQNNTISIDARLTISKLLHEFDFQSNSRQIQTPMPSGYKSLLMRMK